MHPVATQDAIQTLISLNIKRYFSGNSSAKMGICAHFAKIIIFCKGLHHANDYNHAPGSEGYRPSFN